MGDAGRPTFQSTEQVITLLTTKIHGDTMVICGIPIIIVIIVLLIKLLADEYGE